MPHGTDSHLVKSAHKKTKYSKKQVEHLEKCLNPDTGPLHFMSNFLYNERSSMLRISKVSFTFLFLFNL